VDIKSFFDLIDRAKYSWGKVHGLLLSIALVLYLCNRFLYPLITPLLPEHKIFFEMFSSFLITVFIIIIWAIDTNRFIVPNFKKLTLGVILKIDENETEYKINTIINNCVKDINNNFSSIRVKVLPVNYMDNNSQIEKYLRSHPSQIDAFLFATVESGKQRTSQGTEKKIIITNLSFIGNFNVNENHNIFRSSVNLARDLSIRFLYKDWAYIEDNSLHDKKRIKLNFKDRAPSEKSPVKGTLQIMAGH